MASGAISLMGVFSLKPCFSPRASICQNNILFLYLPRGTIPPSKMDLLSSGIILLKSIWLIIPNPLHRGQAPWGELNEKE
ncbi:MAG: hypothetical protein BWX77_00650 [Bacteroidetes bacterium ADurb.Bin090]|nr:MAG: hypothetical protein BWX77_00650 [Bacteroidetes bacterium ADurb.Bin090]